MTDARRREANVERIVRIAYLPKGRRIGATWPGPTYDLVVFGLLLVFLLGYAL